MPNIYILNYMNIIFSIKKGQQKILFLYQPVLIFISKSLEEKMVAREDLFFYFSFLILKPLNKELLISIRILNLPVPSISTYGYLTILKILNPFGKYP